MHDNLSRLGDALPYHELAYELLQRRGSNASIACGH